MRKFFIGAMALCISLVAASSALADNNNSTLTGKFSPAKVSASRFTQGSLFIETTTVDAGDSGTPAAPTIFPTPTSNVIINFDNSLKFTTKGLAKCTANLAGTTTAQAQTACPTSQVGTGSANVCINNGTGGCVNFTAVVTAFNGDKSLAGNPTIILHSRVDALSSTTILTGELIDSTKGADYGKALDVPVPAIAGGGGAITDFKTTVKKNYSAGGHTHHYVSAMCDDGNKVWNYSSVFTYSDAGTDPASDTQTCKVA